MLLSQEVIWKSYQKVTVKILKSTRKTLREKRQHTAGNVNVPLVWCISFLTVHTCLPRVYQEWVAVKKQQHVINYVVMAALTGGPSGPGGPGSPERPSAPWEIDTKVRELVWTSGSSIFSILLRWCFSCTHIWLSPKCGVTLNLHLVQGVINNMINDEGTCSVTPCCIFIDYSNVSNTKWCCTTN